MYTATVRSEWHRVKPAPAAGGTFAAVSCSDPLGAHDWHDEGYVERWIADRADTDGERRAHMRLLASAIAADRRAPIRVLDVGVGYGALTEELLGVFGSARVTGIDFSEPMLARARAALERFGDQVTLRVADLQDPAWTDGLGIGFDAVVSSQAIHNVRYPDRIRAIYAEILPLLRPGGCFMNLDIFSPPGDRSGAAYAAARAGPRRPPPAYDPGHAPPLPLRDHLDWLDAAGFVEADVLMKDLRQALIVGYRPL